MSILKRNTQIPPPSQTDKAFYAKKCQIWAKNGPNIGPHFLGGGGGELKLTQAKKSHLIWQPPKKSQRDPKTAQKWPFWAVLGGFCDFLGGRHIKAARFRSFLAKIYHPKERIPLQGGYGVGTG